MTASFLWCPLAALMAQTTSDYAGSFVFPLDSEALRYDAPSNDPVAKLQRALELGERKLTRDPKTGYLKAILAALDVPVSSQSLVFSKTSFQLHRISPDTPRALYFNDDVYVGYVPGGDVLELSAVDPEKGGVFYSMPQSPSERPRIVRRDDCLQCHASPRTLGVPGHIVRSVYPIGEGFPATNAPSYNTDHRSPFELRFGGWYVTGAAANMKHLGNALAPDGDQPEKLAPLPVKRVDLTRYLTPHSDILAQLVLAHETAGHNYIARVNYEVRTALHMQQAINKSLGEAPDKLSESTERRIDRGVDILLRYLTFADERPLPGPVTPSSSFAADFAARGPKDSKGRSLRDFDLQSRVFRYPLSYLVYSEAFDQLPGVVRERFFAKLRAAAPAPVLEILQETKK